MSVLDISKLKFDCSEKKVNKRGICGEWRLSDSIVENLQKMSKEKCFRKGYT